VLSFASVNFYIVNISSVVKIRLLCYLGCLFANTYELSMVFFLKKFACVFPNSASTPSSI
jgi:hypothetical protein